MDGRNGMSSHNGQKGLNSFTLGFGDDYHGKKVFQIIQAGQLFLLPRITLMAIARLHWHSIRICSNTPVFNLDKHATVCMGTFLSDIGLQVSVQRPTFWSTSIGILFVFASNTAVVSS